MFNRIAAITGIVIVILSTITFFTMVYLIFVFPFVIAQWQEQQRELSIAQHALVQASQFLCSYGRIFLVLPILAVLGGGALTHRARQLRQHATES